MRMHENKFASFSRPERSGWGGYSKTLCSENVRYPEKLYYQSQAAPRRLSCYAIGIWASRTLRVVWFSLHKVLKHPLISAVLILKTCELVSTHPHPCMTPGSEGSVAQQIGLALSTLKRSSDFFNQVSYPFPWWNTCTLKHAVFLKICRTKENRKRIQSRGFARGIAHSLSTVEKNLDRWIELVELGIFPRRSSSLSENMKRLEITVVTNCGKKGQKN